MKGCQFFYQLVFLQPNPGFATRFLSSRFWNLVVRETVQQVCQNPIHLRWHRTPHHRGFYMFHSRLLHFYGSNSTPDGQLFWSSLGKHCLDSFTRIFDGHPLHFPIWQCVCNSLHLLFSGVCSWASGCLVDSEVGRVLYSQLDCGRCYDYCSALF